MLLKVLLCVLVLIPTIIALVLFKISRIICSPVGEAIAVMYPGLALICVVSGGVMLIPLVCAVVIMCNFIRNRWRENNRRRKIRQMKIN